MNIYDIAKEAGVSISTVSRVLNNGKSSSKTREKVQAVLEKYNYKPNEIARGLVKNSMKTVAVMITDIRVNHYANTAFILEQVFRENGYNVLFCNTGGLMDNNRYYIVRVLQKQIDGIVFVGSIFNEIEKEPDIMGLLKSVPIVLANGHLDLPNAYSVSVNDRMGIKLAVDHMYSKGHRSIAYVQDMDTFSANEKTYGFIQAMDSLELDGHVFYSEYGLEGGAEVAGRILDSGIGITAIVFGEDFTAVGAMKAIRKRGLEIPSDIAISGYNNLDSARATEIELTSVDNKYEMLASMSAKLLIDTIDGKNVSSLQIQPTLVVRDST